MLTRTELKSDRMSESMRAFWPADTSGSGEIEKKKGQILAYVWKSTSHSVLYIPRLLAKSFFGDECWIFENGMTGLKKTRKNNIHPLSHTHYIHPLTFTHMPYTHTHAQARTHTFSPESGLQLLHPSSYLSVLSSPLESYGGHVFPPNPVWQHHHTADPSGSSLEYFPTAASSPPYTTPHPPTHPPPDRRLARPS